MSSDDVDDVDDDDDGDEARVIKTSDGAELREEDGEQCWVSCIDCDVVRNEWKDVWGPLAKLPEEKRLEEYCLHGLHFDQLAEAQPLEAEKKLLSLGYRSVGEYYRVQGTIKKHFGTPDGPTIDDVTLDNQAYVNAVMRANARFNQATGAAVVASNPDMLAPVEGVTVEIYAQIAARIAQQISQGDLMKLLASHKLDLATWERANKVWTDRMSKDTTATIATIYGNAFMSSGQGQHGAAAQAVAQFSQSGAAAGGKEPMPFEKCCEIQGAMTAWSTSGKDVNALLKKHFNMVAADWSAANTWWLSQLTADFARFEEYNQKCAEFQAKYGGNTGGGDADIDF